MMHRKKSGRKKSVKHNKRMMSEKMMDMHEDMLHHKEDMLHRGAERMEKKDAVIHKLLSKLHKKEHKSLPKSIRKDVRMARGEKKIEKVMHEFKEGMLHSGSKRGPKVTSRRQALAIALNSARRAKKRRK